MEAISTWVSVPLFIHGVVGSLVCIGCFVAWHLSAPDPTKSFWWWIFPFFAFALSLTSHAYYRSEQYWSGIVVTVLLINCMLFVLDGLTSSAFPTWWMYPAGASAILLGALKGLFAGELFWPVLDAFLVVNILLYNLWGFEEGKGGVGLFPWWVVSFFGLGIPVGMAFIYERNKEHDLVLYGAWGLLMVNTILLFVWGFLESKFPWFGIGWLLSIGGAVAYWRWRVKKEAFPTLLNEGQ